MFPQYVNVSDRWDALQTPVGAECVHASTVRVGSFALPSAFITGLLPSTPERVSLSELLPSPTFNIGTTSVRVVDDYLCYNGDGTDAGSETGAIRIFWRCVLATFVFWWCPSHACTTETSNHIQRSPSPNPLIRPSQRLQV